MTEMYKIQPKGLYFVTLTVVGGIDVFTRHEYCDLLVDTLNYCIDNKRLRVYEYAILPSQLYMIADVEQGKGNLPKVLRDLKSYSAKLLLRAISEHPEESRKEWLMRLFQFFANRYQHDAEHHFWQFGNQPVDIEKVVKKAGYQMTDIVAVTVYVTDLNDVEAMNKVYIKLMPNPKPARATVQVAGLIGGAKIEISAIAVKP